MKNGGKKQKSTRISHSNGQVSVRQLSETPTNAGELEKLVNILPFSEVTLG